MIRLQVLIAEGSEGSAAEGNKTAVAEVIAGRTRSLGRSDQGRTAAGEVIGEQNGRRSRIDNRGRTVAGEIIEGERPKVE